jgi:hypothetical protein
MIAAIRFRNFLFKGTGLGCIVYKRAVTRLSFFARLCENDCECVFLYLSVSAPLAYLCRTLDSKV